MANLQQVSFTNDQYAPDVAQIERQRKLAEMLQQQSQAQADPNQMAGGWVIPYSPMQGFSKVAQAFGAKKAGEKADEMARALREGQSKDATLWAQGMPQPRPESIPNFPGEVETQTGKMVQPTKQEQLAWIMQGSRNPYSSPIAQMLLAQALKDPESNFQKVDPKDYTPESVARFAKSGNHADLVPVRKKEVVSLGGTSKVVDPYAAENGAVMPHTESPDSAANRALKLWEFNNLSAAERARLTMEGQKVGMTAQELFFNTGQRVGTGVNLPANTPPPGMAPTQNLGAPYNQPGMPQGAPPMAPQGVRPVPQPMPQPAPRVAPQAAPSPQAAPTPGQPGQPALTPKAAQELALATAKQRAEMENKRSFNMTGLNAQLNEAEKILKAGIDRDAKALPGKRERNAPTSSMAGAAGDWLASIVGYAPNGAAEADQLRSIGGSLVAKMPRMEGPQSDKDVQLYREMAGQLGDATLPISRRLAALQTVRDLYAKYEGGTQQQAQPQTLRFDAQGNKIP